MMTLDGVFRLVAAGRIDAAGRYRWTCPLCHRKLGFSKRPEDRDREAVRHGLAHAKDRSVRFPQVVVKPRHENKTEAFVADSRSVSRQLGLAIVG